MKNRLRELRAAKEWSQSDLADKLGVSRQTVNAIETEKYDPTCRWHSKSPACSKSKSRRFLSWTRIESERGREQSRPHFFVLPIKF